MTRLGLGFVLGVLALWSLGIGSSAQAATPCADLVIDGVASTPAAPVKGQPATIAITVRNAGTCAAEPFTVQWRPDILASATPAAQLAGLNAGATTVVSVPYTFQRTGIFLSVATVDVTNAVAETNEGNNLVLKTFTPSSGVDLVVSALSVSPASPVAGQQATVSVTVTNQGANDASAFRVDWSPSLVAAGFPQQVGGLAAGASTTLTYPFTFPIATTYVSVATVDAGSSVPESDEFNNAKTLTTTVIPFLPDLVVTNVSTSPSPAFAGSNVTATITVSNVGLAPAGSFTVQWLPWLLGTAVTTPVGGLAPGASTTVTLSSLFTINGTFDGVVTVDSASTVTEVNEFNNTGATHVTVGPPTLNTQKVATGGFGDYQNSYSWSMTWFKGKLYVGTARSMHCVEEATLDFYYPGQGFYLGPLDGLPPQISRCAPDYYDLDLRAEIWQYTPETGMWKRVYQSPTVPNPRAPGKSVGRDIGYRGMAVYTDSHGEQALYVGGVTSDEYIPELAEPYPPRILRSVDGETFTPLPTYPGLIHNTSGDQRPIGFRAMTVFDNRLFVTASGGLGGDGVILEVKDPSGPSPQWVQVSPNTMQVYEMEPFNGTLYIGSAAASGGYGVFKLTDQSTVPYTWTQVVPGGAGRGSAITSVVSMNVFKGRLYVGANGWAQGSNAQPASEEIRVNPDDTWDVVAGETRTLPDGTVKRSISGLGDGFGNFWTAHLWRAETHNGAMYIGTNDASGAWQVVPGADQLLAPEYGFDLWGTCDGQYWWQVTRNAFGDGQWNFGARTIASTPFGLFVGSTNHVQGTSVWKGDASPCGAGGGSQFGPAQRGSGSAGSATTAPTTVALPRPGRLLAEATTCGTGLAWDATTGATGYRILRADYRAVSVAFKAPPKLPDGSTFEGAMPVPVVPGAKTKGRQVWTAGPYRVIGTTTMTSFVDQTAKKGGRYDYEVVAVGSSGKQSEPSNVAPVPTQTATVTFGELDAALGRLTDGPKHGGIGTVVTRTFIGLAHTARTSWREDDRAGSLRSLGQLRSAIGSHATRLRDAAALADVKDAIFRLERRATAAARCTR